MKPFWIGKVFFFLPPFKVGMTAGDVKKCGELQLLCAFEVMFSKKVTTSH